MVLLPRLSSPFSCSCVAARPGSIADALPNPCSILLQRGPALQPVALKWPQSCGSRVVCTQHFGLPLQPLDATCLLRLSLQDRLEMEEEESGARSPLITFSHFLPHQVPLMRWLCKATVLLRHRHAAAKFRYEDDVLARSSSRHEKLVCCLSPGCL